VRNLATAGYTSAHSLVKLALVGLDLDPDYVIVHDGWNDTYAWGFGDAFRGDYWHAIGPWSPPEAPLRWLVRASVAYRWLAYGTEQPAPWTVLNAWREEAVAVRGDPETATPAERAAFERNVHSMATLARDRGAVVVLATTPFSAQRAREHPAEASRLRTANDVLRSLAAASDAGVVLADLERELEGRLEGHFLDLAHLDGEGDAVVGRAMARFLAGDRARRHAARDAGP
jgi:hypothetical protein